MKNFKRYTVTAALPYANGPLHIGHIAGAYLPADIYVRFLRLRENDVIFICGSDEHGAAITLKAKKENITPQQLVDKYHELMKNAFADFGIEFSIYHRTSTPLHHQTAADFFSVMHKKGKFTEETSEQYYDEENKLFLADRYITGTCPKCGNESAYGDQCEKCGSTLSPTDLINPKSVLSGKTPVMKTTSHWYLPLGEHEVWLKEWINKGTLDGIEQHNPAEWKNQVIGQCNSWLDAGLQSRAMTRDLDWGVKVPLPNAEGKVLYVWLDAPIGYISATKQWAMDNNTDWEQWWKSEDTKLLHFVGKDNIVFHALIFPVMLRSHGEFILENNVPANEFLNLEGDKISTSRNHAIWLHEYLQDFPNRQDELRYVLCSIAPESKDSEFTWKDFQARNNNELVAILGNFVNRSVVLTHKYFEGKIPDVKPDTKFLLGIKDAYEKVEQNIEKYRFREALSEAMNVARSGNKYLADNEPWKLINTDKEKTAEVIHTSLLVAAHLSILLEPFLPFTTKKLRTLLGITKPVSWFFEETQLIRPGQEIGQPVHLFTNIDDETIQKQLEKLHAMKPVVAVTAAEPAAIKPSKPEITFEDFAKSDIRIGTILEAEKVPKADKLLKLLVDTGIDKRTVVSGIAAYYKPEDIIGQKVSILVNLAPRKLRGIESQGMILMAEDVNGKLCFVQPSENITNGGEVK